MKTLVSKSGILLIFSAFILMVSSAFGNSTRGRVQQSFNQKQLEKELAALKEETEKAMNELRAMSPDNLAITQQEARLQAAQAAEIDQFLNDMPISTEASRLNNLRSDLEDQARIRANTGDELLLELREAEVDNGEIGRRALADRIMNNTGKYEGILKVRTKAGVFEMKFKTRRDLEEFLESFDEDLEKVTMYRGDRLTADELNVQNETESLRRNAAAASQDFLEEKVSALERQQEFLHKERGTTNRYVKSLKAELDRLTEAEFERNSKKPLPDIYKHPLHYAVIALVAYFVTKPLRESSEDESSEPVSYEPFEAAQ